MMAETPKQYTSRLRLERAALRLVLLDDNILDIALIAVSLTMKRLAEPFAVAFVSLLRPFVRSRKATQCAPA
jgi:hypothetical protein